jgi:hypothetical protein
MLVSIRTYNHGGSHTKVAGLEVKLSSYSGENLENCGEVGNQKSEISGGEWKMENGDWKMEVRK